MTLFVLFLLFLAAICFVGHTFGWTVRRGNLLSAGLFFWVLSVFVQALPAYQPND